MSRFDNRLKSHLRINELEKVIIKTVEIFELENPELSMGEVAAVMLKILTSQNNYDLKDNL